MITICRIEIPATLFADLCGYTLLKEEGTQCFYKHEHESIKNDSQERLKLLQCWARETLLCIGGRQRSRSVPKHTYNPYQQIIIILQERTSGERIILQLYETILAIQIIAYINSLAQCKY